MVLQLLCSGVKGFVGLSYNFVASLYYDIMHAFKERNIEKCRELQRASHRFTEFGNSVSDWGHKYIFSLLSGLDFGDARPPNVKLSDEDKRKLKQMLAEWNTHYDALRGSTLSKL